jgi:hypothetical protein
MLGAATTRIEASIDAIACPTSNTRSTAISATVPPA